MRYQEIRTDISQMDEEIAEDLVFTGVAAWDYLNGKQDLNESGNILAYCREDSEIVDYDELELSEKMPDGDQNLFLILDEETPTAFPYGDHLLADPDTVLRDFKKANPYEFEERMGTEYERDLALNLGSGDLRECLKEKYIDE